MAGEHEQMADDYEQIRIHVRGSDSLLKYCKSQLGDEWVVHKEPPGGRDVRVGVAHLHSGTPGILVIAGQHPREHNSVWAALLLMKRLKTEQSPCLVTIVPCANPTGFTETFRGDRYKRSNENGVDLNRNFETTGWEACLTEGRSGGVGWSNGATAGSEYETQLVQELICSGRYKCVLNLHCYGNMLMYPPCKDTIPDAVVPALAGIAQTINEKCFGSKMKVMPFCRIYKAHGTTVQYCLENKVVGFCIEAGCSFEDDAPTVLSTTHALLSAVGVCYASIPDRFDDLAGASVLSLNSLHKRLDRERPYRGYMHQLPTTCHVS